MKLLSATVRNYRCHRDTTVDLDGDLVLIHGPNESGKSTLAEAIHCALFLKAKGTTGLHQAMQSEDGGTPEVEVQFEVAGIPYSLQKTFGGSGNTTLKTEGEPARTGTSAEEALAGLLGVEGTVSGGGIEAKIKKRWGHLWVRQGSSDSTPLDSIEESQDQLHGKLQTRSGQALISSPADNAVIDELARWEAENFTNRGYKTNSDIDKAQKAFTAAEERAVKARAILDELRQAVAAFEQADVDIERYSTNLNEAETKLKDVDAQLKSVAELQDQLKEKSRTREETENKLNLLQAADAEIRSLETKLKELVDEASPMQQVLENLRADTNTRKADYEKACTAREQSSQVLGQARNIFDVWQAHVESLRMAKQVSVLQKRLEQIEHLRQKIKEQRKQLAPLENFSETAIKKLAQTEREAELARMKLEAYALQVEVLEADQDITLEGRVLQKGQKDILSHAAELQVGERTRIRLTPGGAENLEAARVAHESAAAKTDECLKELGIGSVEAARQQLRKKDNFARELESLENQLKAAEADEAEADLEKAEKNLAQLQARRDAAVPEGAEMDFSDDLQACEVALEKAQAALEESTMVYTNAETQEKAMRKVSDQATQAQSKAEEEYNKRSVQISDLKSRLDFALERSGDAGIRSKGINAARATLEQAQEAEQSICTQLEELGADRLTLDAKRLRAAVEADQTKLADAKERKVTAQANLSSSGNRDPESDLKQAEAERERCQKRFNQLKHQADVRSLLLGKLRAARKASIADLAKPLEDAVNPYLQSLFGGGRARLHWAEDGSRLESFELDRTAKDQGLYSFENLSHGTREQVALALRLGMAQLLAEDHGGCLPLVFDDAFTHADKDRIEKLKTLLYQASENGLQILLLTCHPENYSGLGGIEATLGSPRPRPTTSVANVAVPQQSDGRASVAQDAGDPPASLPVPGCSSEAFLEALRGLGGSAGNTALRQNLGWDEPSYDAIKSELLGSGEIQTGRGRGGSVKLTS